MTARILVLDGDAGAAITIVQSLGRAGYDVTLAATSVDERAFRSRYVTASLVSPDPLLDKVAFQEWATGLTGFDLVIPATERTMIPLHEIRDRPSLAGKVALPPAAAVDVAFDKERVRALAERLGVVVPENIVVESLAQLDALRGRLDAWFTLGAVVLKSTRSKVWGEGGGRELAVQMVVDYPQLVNQAGQLLEAGPVQLQQWVPGHGVGVEVLADRGEIVLMFAHERLHELPMTGGGSCYRRGIEPPAALVESARRLMKALSWHGVAMIEFRVDPDSGGAWMMEINGRFWGSLALAQFGGVDFPRALVRLLLEGVRPEPVPGRRVWARAVGRDLRWMRQMTALRLADATGRRQVPAERKLMLTQPLGRSVAEWARLLGGREVWDGAALDDPAPIVFEIGSEIARVPRAVIRRWQRRRVRRGAIAAWSRPLGEVRRILVLCSGNICRSAYVGVRLDAEVTGGVSVRSGALVGPSGRPTPGPFLRAAAARGVDLSHHRSHAIDDADLSWADLILIMDDGHHAAIAQRGPEVLKKSRWLGGLLATGLDADPVIEDPIDFGAAELVASLDRMDAAIAKLLDRVRH